MDDLTARLWAEKSNRPSSDEKVAHEETLRRLNEDLDLFLAGASANWGGPPAALHGRPAPAVQDLARPT